MTTEPIEPEPPAEDPATPERRIELSRAMLVWAIHGYEQASHRWGLVREACPNLPQPSWPRDDEEREERERWSRLFTESDEDFNAAELGSPSGSRTSTTSWPPGRRTDEAEGEYFVPRAVRHHGSVYVLAYGARTMSPTPASWRSTASRS